MKKIIMIWLLLAMSFVYGEVVELSENHTSEDLYQMAIQLAEQYPDIIKLEIIGYSNDERPIFVMQLTENVSEIDTAETYVEKYHISIEGGIHSRENVAPVMLLKMVETYAMDYYDNSVISSINMEDELKHFVFHFIPLSNPDGYDFANFGIHMLSDAYEKQLMSFRSKNYEQYKSNANGVDLNRNFPGVFYDEASGAWRDIWNKVHNDYVSRIPGSGFYFGPYAASEPETQALMAYFTKYDFRNYLSYHSKGEVIYWHKWMMPDSHNTHTWKLTHLISRYTGYTMLNDGYEASSSGYSTDFTAMTTLKPSITIETVSSYKTLPVGLKEIVKAYDEQLLVPVIAAFEGRRVGYFDHKIYVDDVYLRDYEDLETAKAWAEQLGGLVLTYEGKPVFHYSDDYLPVTRLEATQMIVDALNIEVNNPLNAFKDCNDQRVLEARAIGIVSGYLNLFKPEQEMTYESAYVMISNAFIDERSDLEIVYEPFWAKGAVANLVSANVLSRYHLERGPILKIDFQRLVNHAMDVINERDIGY
jgi:hypothetical protein